MTRGQSPLPRWMKINRVGGFAGAAKPGDGFMHAMAPAANRPVFRKSRREFMCIPSLRGGQEPFSGGYFLYINESEVKSEIITA